MVALRTELLERSAQESRRLAARMGEMVDALHMCDPEAGPEAELAVSDTAIDPTAAPPPLPAASHAPLQLDQDDGTRVSYRLTPRSVAAAKTATWEVDLSAEPKPTAVES